MSSIVVVEMSYVISTYKQLNCFSSHEILSTTIIQISLEYSFILLKNRCDPKNKSFLSKLNIVYINDTHVPQNLGTNLHSCFPFFRPLNISTMSPLRSSVLQDLLSLLSTLLTKLPSLTYFSTKQSLPYLCESLILSPDSPVLYFSFPFRCKHPDFFIFYTPLVSKTGFSSKRFTLCNLLTEENLTTFSSRFQFRTK